MHDNVIGDVHAGRFYWAILFLYFAFCALWVVTNITFFLYFCWYCTLSEMAMENVVVMFFARRWYKL